MHEQQSVEAGIGAVLLVALHIVQTAGTTTPFQESVSKVNLFPTKRFFESEEGKNQLFKELRWAVEQLSGNTLTLRRGSSRHSSKGMYPPLSAICCAFSTPDGWKPSSRELPEGMIAVSMTPYGNGLRIIT
jgi:hypothetical protein